MKDFIFDTRVLNGGEITTEAKTIVEMNEGYS